LSLYFIFCRFGYTLNRDSSVPSLKSFRFYPSTLIFASFVHVVKYYFTIPRHPILVCASGTPVRPALKRVVIAAMQYCYQQKKPVKQKLNFINAFIFQSFCKIRVLNFPLVNRTVSGKKG
jgi:hypothetical protein